MMNGMCSEPLVYWVAHGNYHLSGYQQMVVAGWHLDTLLGSILLFLGHYLS